MTQLEKETWVENLLKMMDDIGKISNHVSQASAWFTQIPTFIESIYNAGREEGFKEGYRKAKQENERKYSKLN